MNLLQVQVAGNLVSTSIFDPAMVGRRILMTWNGPLVSPSPVFNIGVYIYNIYLDPNNVQVLGTGNVVVIQSKVIPLRLNVPNVSVGDTIKVTIDRTAKTMLIQDVTNGRTVSATAVDGLFNYQ